MKFRRIQNKFLFVLTNNCSSCELKYYCLFEQNICQSFKDNKLRIGNFIFNSLLTVKNFDFRYPSYVYKLVLDAWFAHLIKYKYISKEYAEVVLTNFNEYLKNNV